MKSSKEAEACIIWYLNVDNMFEHVDGGVGVHADTVDAVQLKTGDIIDPTVTSPSTAHP